MFTGCLPSYLPRASTPAPGTAVLLSTVDEPCSGPHPARFPEPPEGPHVSLFVCDLARGKDRRVQARAELPCRLCLCLPLCAAGPRCPLPTCGTRQQPLRPGRLHGRLQGESSGPQVGGRLPWGWGLEHGGS